MNTKKITIAAIAALIAATASFAGTSKGVSKDQTSHRAQIVSSMIANHDGNQDGALDSVELAASIESLYEMRQNAIKYNRDAMVERGILSPEDAQNGVITLSLLPEDGAALLMSRADSNHNHALEANELMNSTPIWGTLNLGTGPFFKLQS